MKTVSDIRKTFLDYFKDQNHEVVSSSALVPNNDPTLLFTNAGMVQFKDLFTGTERRSYTKATTSQKCLRAGGKHNDLENVGYTARHHTFFEMLGNFSFGDYFKEEAIHHAWTLITEGYGLPKDKLLVTVYSEDDEAALLWKKIAGFSEDRIIRIPTSDNFWSMGDTGPCGPCSEIFFDHGEEIPGGPPGSPEQDGDRFIEIWNLVFMQFEQLKSGERINLPKPSIDTGMGLERIAAVLQGVHNNYDVDLFARIIEASQDISGIKAVGPHLSSHRVMADHLRASAFLIADGVLPSNEGRGYVLRRIMRRAMRHAHIIGCKDTFMHRLVSTLVEVMGGHYPELVRAESLINQTLKLEEERFKETLGRGLKLLEEGVAPLKSGEALPGEIAFKLYDTYGFPVDLTADVLKSQDRAVDMDGFNLAMEAQKAKARASWVGSGESALDQVWFDIQERVGSTEFVGYNGSKSEAVVQAIVVEGKETDSLSGYTGEAYVVLNQTPFYGESGGQMGDHGILATSTETFTVEDTLKKLGSLHVHKIQCHSGSLKVGQPIIATIDEGHRSALKANHSATHLLHAALREKFGASLVQKGSLVAADRLRFDFSHPTPISKADLKDLESKVNEEIRNNTKTVTQLMPSSEAIKLGAMALFGEKYPDEVRVVQMGSQADEAHYSFELCGGTHVNRTGDIGLFKIISEVGISSGVRRIEALTGEGAIEYLNAREALLNEVCEALKTPPATLKDRVSALMQERKKLEQELSKARIQGNSAQSQDSKTIGHLKLVWKNLEDVPAKDLKPLVDQMKQDLGSGIAVATSTTDGNVSVVIGVTEDLIKTHNAVDLVRLVSSTLGGAGGGGRPDLAQAGGKESSKIPQAQQDLEKHLAS